MPTRPIPVVGPTYTNRSLPVSAQVTQNFYVEVNPDGKEFASLMPFPGLPLFVAAGSGANRGVGTHAGLVFVVNGSALYSIDSAKTVTSIGTIEGTGRVSMDSDGSNLVVATGSGKPYTWDGTTLTQGTDADLPHAHTVQYLNRRVIYDGAGSLVSFADLDAPLSVNSANQVRTDTTPDDAVAGLAYQQQYFAFCEKSIEPWYPTGSGNPPYALVKNGVKNLGTVARHSVAKNKGHAYFLGSDLMPYRMTGVSLMPIGNPAIGRSVQDYSVHSDAIGVCFAFDSQEFYLLTFPAADVSWLFSEGTGLWTTLSHKGGRHVINGHVQAFGKQLVTDYRNGNLYELDFDTHTINGEAIIRQRDTIAIDGRTFGRADARVFMDRLRLRIDPGASLISAESQIIMQYSDDDGKTWSSERWAGIGDQGEYGYIVEWLGLGMFYRRIFRFRMSDPIRWVLIGASADVELDIA